MSRSAHHPVLPIRFEQSFQQYALITKALLPVLFIAESRQMSEQPNIKEKQLYAHKNALLNLPVYDYVTTERFWVLLISFYLRHSLVM
jgi:hypothetical protein